MMIVDVIFQLKDGPVIGGYSNWDADITHRVGDILKCGIKEWEVIAVDRIYQGCFGRPTHRHHNLKLKPIGNNDMPIKGDILIKQ
jgi:hypothetical protein